MRGRCEPGHGIKNYLELNDFDVTLERDGRQLAWLHSSVKFDICLLDVMMPNMDGFTWQKKFATSTLMCLFLPQCQKP